MAPVRRRVRGGQGAGAGTAAKTAKQEAAIKEKEAESDEDTTPTLNIVALALKYQDERGDLSRKKGGKLTAEMKKLVTEYTNKVDEVLINQDKEITTLWQTYAQATIQDEEERRELFRTLDANYQQIEKLRNIIETRSDNIEKSRNESNITHLGKEEKRIIASHKALVKTVRMKKTAFNTRVAHTGAGNKTRAFK